MPYLDRIIVIDQGKIIEDGSYEELIRNDGFFKNDYLVSIKEKADGEHEEEH